ncbi:hypothetical protein AAH991_36425 [Microbispora sp. ZYX-F-249]|uniref:HNH endonuclease n=1 Tax=Microbispora maris TaxID=3144104 RepID=A0ABV0B193_9ACTN
MGRPLTVIQREDNRDKPCVMCQSFGDIRPSYTMDGLCRTHARRRSEGAPLDRIPEKAPDGAGHIDKNGYRHVTVNGRRQFEHRVITEGVLGRPLWSDEEIHHVNGNRADNRVDGPFKVDERGRLRSGNLEIWSSNQPRGQEIGPKLEWAVELLTTYGEFDADRLRAVLAVHGSAEERRRYSRLRSA